MYNILKKVSNFNKISPIKRNGFVPQNYRNLLSFGTHSQATKRKDLSDNQLLLTNSSGFIRRKH